MGEKGGREKVLTITHMDDKTFSNFFGERFEGNTTVELRGKVYRLLVKAGWMTPTTSILLNTEGKVLKPYENYGFNGGATMESGFSIDDKALIESSLGSLEDEYGRISEGGYIPEYSFVDLAGNGDTFFLEQEYIEPVDPLRPNLDIYKAEDIPDEYKEKILQFAQKAWRKLLLIRSIHESRNAGQAAVIGLENNPHMPSMRKEHIVLGKDGVVAYVSKEAQSWSDSFIKEAAEIAIIAVLGGVDLEHFFASDEEFMTLFMFEYLKEDEDQFISSIELAVAKEDRDLIVHLLEDSYAQEW